MQGILRAYPQVVCGLGFADARLHGPTRLTAHGEIPAPVGGGTDLRPFCFEVHGAGAGGEAGVAVYLTDGFGTFPATGPGCPTLWVVTPGGLAVEQFPFGEVVRMVG